MNDGSPMSTRITEQLTQAGRTIEQASFAIIDREARPHGYNADQWHLVRRLIHASADFEFNGLTRFHPAAVQAGIAAVRAGRHRRGCRDDPGRRLPAPAGPFRRRDPSIH